MCRHDRAVPGQLLRDNNDERLLLSGKQLNSEYIPRNKKVQMDYHIVVRAFKSSPTNLLSGVKTKASLYRSCTFFFREEADYKETHCDRSHVCACGMGVSSVWYKAWQPHYTSSQHQSRFQVVFCVHYKGEQTPTMKCKKYFHLFKKGSFRTSGENVLNIVMVQSPGRDYLLECYNK